MRSTVQNFTLPSFPPEMITSRVACTACVKAMHLSGSMLVVGTRTGEVYEMDTTSYSYTLLLQGHGYGTVWGLACHPNEHQYVTVGDDCTCRVWDVASRRMVMVRDLGAKGRSVAYHPDGSQIAIGLAGGGLVVLSADSLDTMHAKKDREEPIHELKYSPNGQYLAAGSHDNYIDVYDVGKNYGRTGVAKGHASYIRHLDWSQDSTVMQSNSGDFEMLFWEMPSGNRSSSRRTRETSTGPRGRAWRGGRCRASCLDTPWARTCCRATARTRERWWRRATSSAC